MINVVCMFAGWKGPCKAWGGGGGGGIETGLDKNTVSQVGTHQVEIGT